MLHRFFCFLLCFLPMLGMASSASTLSRTQGLSYARTAVEKTADLRRAYLGRLSKDFSLLDKATTMSTVQLSTAGNGVREMGQGSVSLTIGGTPRRVMVVFAAVPEGACARKMVFLAVPYVQDNILYAHSQLSASSPFAMRYRGAMCSYALVGSPTYQLVDSSADNILCSGHDSNTNVLTGLMSADGSFAPLSTQGDPSPAEDFCALFNNKVIDSGV